MNVYNDLTPSESNPYFAYAKKHNLPYWVVINYAQYCARTHAAKIGVAVKPTRWEWTAARSVIGVSKDGGNHAANIMVIEMLEMKRRAKVFPLGNATVL